MFTIIASRYRYAPVVNQKHHVDMDGKIFMYAVAAEQFGLKKGEDLVSPSI